MNYVHNAEPTMQPLSPLFYLVRLKLNVKPELQAHSYMYNLPSILQQENLSSSVLQMSSSSSSSLSFFLKNKVIDCERVNSSRSQLQSDDLLALYRTLWPQSIPHRANSPLNQIVEVECVLCALRTVLTSEGDFLFRNTNSCNSTAVMRS